MSKEPITKQTSPVKAGGCLAAFFSVFFLAGLAGGIAAYRDKTDEIGAYFATGFFCLIGLIGMIWGIRTAMGKTGANPETVADNYLPKRRTTREPSITLHAGKSRIGKLAGMIFFCLFWNGIVGFFVYNLVDEWDGGIGNYGLAAFLSIFVIIGLGICWGVFHFFLALFNPKPVLSLPTDAVRLGEPFDVAWDMMGNVSRVSQLRIGLVGEEIARYRRGTDTVTVNETFAELVFCDTTDTEIMRAGAASIVVPPDVMHSFKANSNEVQWKLKVQGDIPKWPDIDDEFNMVIWPAGYKPERDERNPY